MAWFKGKLYVGTSQSLHCMELAGMQAAAPSVPNIYPPKDPDIACTPSPYDLPSGAEIWQYDPGTTTWTRVFKSPEAQADGALPIPGQAGKFVAPDVGFRNMHEHDFVDSSGNARQVLMISGVGPGFYLGSAVGNARLLWTEDGTTFNVVQRTAPIFSKITNSSYRGAASYNGKFYVIAGAVTGSGVVLEASDPTDGSTYQMFSPVGISIYEMEPFNGYLYLGTHNPAGFDVYKTTGGATRPLALTDVTLVMTKGGDNPNNQGNMDAISLHEFQGRLYVGGNAMNNIKGAELFRINPGVNPGDPDTWDLISGLPRTTENKLPLSGFGVGMGWPFNEHMWRMETFDDRLYLGTFDISTQAKNIAAIGPLLEPAMGFDLFDTADGVNWSVIDRGGFVSEPCLSPYTGPNCQGLNFGVRNMKATPLGLFLGTANYYYGTQIWLGTPPGFVAGASVTSASTALGAPTNLYAEGSSTKRFVAWTPVPGAVAYQIFRADGSSFQVPDATGSFMTLSLFPKYHYVTSSTKPIYVDTVSSSSTKSWYVVKAVGANGHASAASNVAPVPNLGFRPTLTSVATVITSLTKRFATPQAYTNFTAAYNAARADALNGNLSSLVTLTGQVSANSFDGGRLLDRIGSEDLAMQLTRLVQRLQFVATGQLAITSVQ